MKKISLFVHWDKDHIIDPYVLSYIKALHTISQEVVFISNCPLNTYEQQKIRSYVSSIVIRENKGIDFGAWKEVLLARDLARLSADYDELILANNSCYAPLFPLQEMFDEMSKRTCDFWGVTENSVSTYTTQDQRVISIPAHIQSYFLVLKKSVIGSPVFADFWKNFDENSERDTAILNGETKLTQLLTQHGFHKDVYIRMIKKVYDPSIVSWQYLMQKRCPTFKVKVFVEAIDAVLPFELMRAVKYQQRMAENNSQYDCKLIEQHLERCYPDIYNALIMHRSYPMVIFFAWMLFKIPGKFFKKLKKKGGIWQAFRIVRQRFLH